MCGLTDDKLAFQHKLSHRHLREVNAVKQDLNAAETDGVQRLSHGRERDTKIEVTGGTNGFRGIRSFMVGGQKMTKLQLYYVVLVVTVLCVAILYRMIYSKTGRAFRAVKGNPIAAESMGINVNMYKMLSFATCGAFAGLAGAFYAIQVGYVSPEAFTTTMSIKILTMCVLGGLGNFYGAAVGAVIIGVGTELLAAFEDYQMIIYGLSIILILKFAPRGVAGGVQRLAEQIRGRASKAASGKEKGERV